MSTSLEGLGATRPPPITYNLPLKLSPLVSPVARGIAAIVPMVLASWIEAEGVGGVHHRATLVI